MKLLPQFPAYETQDVQPRSIMLAGIGLLVTVAVFVGVVSMILSWLRPTDRAIPAVQTQQLRAGARLEIDPSLDAQRLKQEALHRLQGYSWTDRKAGQAHIPIERAIELLARQGWPDADTGGAKP